MFRTAHNFFRFIANSNFQEIRDALEDEKSGGNLLLAHKHIMDLERARDELLAEVHKMNGANTEKEQMLLVNFFKGVNVVVAELAKNMWFIMARTLEMVKGNENGGGPQQVVTCLRIVEREERIDKFYTDARNKNSSAFVPPGRPRRWKE
uniref:Uncharacterized protein n=1 Tax=Caenorhabditis japonica TaxID=281687 RepID=A0A8R1HLD9_CAEJA